MIQYANFEFVKRKVIAYDGEQTFMERYNTSTISIVNPIILIQGEHFTIGRRTHGPKSSIKVTFMIKDEGNTYYMGIHPSTQNILIEFLSQS